VERKELLDKIYDVGFYLVDLNLYLDTHVDSEEALDELNQYSRELAKLREEYEKKFGPLTNFGLQSAEDWEQWISSPWPWEKDFN